MTGRNLRLALEITANLNQARQAIGGLRDDIDQTSDAAEDATNAQNQLTQSAQRSSSEIQSSRSSLADFNDELSQTSSSAEDAAQSNQVLENSVKSLAPHLLSLAGISGGFVAIAVDTLNKAVELDRLAEFSTTGVEQFQYYAAGAKKVGVETEQLAQIYKDAREKVGEFIDNGGGELADFFDRIAPKVGVTAEQFKKLTGPEILQLYVSSLQQAGVSQNEMISYMERIADDATVLLPLLNNNGEGFKKYGDQAKAAGAILGVDVVEQAKIAKEALGQFQNRISGITNQLVANAAPAIVFLAQNLDILTKAGLVVASVYLGKVVPALSASAIAFVAARIEATRYQMTLASMAGIGRASNLLMAFGGLPGLAVTAVSVATGFYLMRDRVDDATLALQQHSKYATETADSLLKLDAAQKSVAKNDLKKSFELQNNELDRQARLFANAIGDIAQYNNQLGYGGTASNELRQIQSQLNQGTISLYDALQRVNKIAMMTPEQRKQLVDSVTKYNELFGKVKENADAQKALGVEVKIAGNATQNQNNILDETTKSAKAAATEVGNLSKAYKDLQQNTLNNMLNNAYRIDQIVKGVNPELAAAKAQAIAGLNADPNSTQTYGRLPDDLDDAVTADFNLTKEREKIEQDITKEKEKQKQIALTQKAIAASTNEQTKNMLMVYNGFIKAGATDPMARYLTSEVGREGDFLNKNLFGSHQDKNNNYTNTGLISYQKSRSKEVMSFLRSKGLIDEKGNIKQLQDAIDAQTEFALYELFNKKEYSKSKDALLNGRNYSDLQQIVGNNFIGWDIKGKKLSQKDVINAQARQTGYKNKLDQLLGVDPNTLLGEFSKLNQVQADITKAQEAEDKNRQSIQEKYFTEDQKLLIEHTNNRLSIIKAGFDQEKETELLLAEDKRFIAEKNKSRLDMLKDVQSELIALDQNYLKSINQNAQADLLAVDEKYKDLKTKIETLLQSAIDPVEKLKLQDAQVKLDLVIDKEKVTADFNNIMAEYDKLQSLRQQRQETLKLQNDSGQISQFQYADGLKAIDAEMKPAMQNLIDQAAILAATMGDAFSVSKVEAMNAALNATDGSFQKFLPTVDQIQERIAGGMTDAIMAWADGTKSASDAFRQFAADFLREIAQMILKQMIFNAVKAASSAFGFAEGGFTGYSSGGYTGAGGKYDYAGIVHKGEVVWSQADIKAWGGVERVESMRKHRGYADGGIVSAPELQAPTMQIPVIQAPQLNDNAAQIAQSSSFNANQNFYLVDDPSRILDTLNSSQGQENIVVMMSRDPSKFKAALKIGG